jgi:hypothetical protein
VKESLVREIEKLLTAVQKWWEDDLNGSPAWLSAEAERVKENCLLFLEATRNGTPHALLKGVSLREFLGASWVDLHSEIYEQVGVVERLLS